MLPPYLMSFLALSLASVQATPVQQATPPFRMKIRTRSAGPTPAFSGNQTAGYNQTFVPNYVLRELSSVVNKYSNAIQIINGANVTADQPPQAGSSPQVDTTSSTLDTENFSQPQQDSSNVHALADTGRNKPDFLSDVAKVPGPPESTNMPLTDYISGSMDVLYHASIGVGTPPQFLNFQVDTGSADLWMASKCNDCYNDEFNPRKSSSYKGTTDHCALNYATGDAGGLIAQDTVMLGNQKVSNQQFCAVQRVSSDFNEEPISGLLGLAFGRVASMEGKTFLENLFAQHKSEQKIVSMYLTRGQPDGSEVFFGGYDFTKATGPISWHPIVSRTFWTLILDNVTLSEGEPVRANLKAAIDSGSSLIHMPHRVTDAMYARIPGSYKTDRYGPDLYAYPCNATLGLGIKLSFGGQPYAVHPADFNLGCMDTDPTMCIGAIVPLAANLGEDFAIVGDAFMKSYYTVFDYAGRVGFAPSINNR